METSKTIDKTFLCLPRNEFPKFIKGVPLSTHYKSNRIYKAKTFLLIHY